MIHRFQHTAMATQFEIRCSCQDAGYARQAARAAFEEVDRIERQLSRFVENSDITRINHLRAGESAIVSYEAMQCLVLAGVIHAETGGAFDISIGTGFETLTLDPGRFEVAAGASAPGGRLGDQSSREPERSGVRLDLGAIGKGYAVDRIADVFEDWELDRVLIDAGSSSVLALEPPDGEDDWPLTISAPDGGGAVLARVAARQRSMGASGIRARHHIVDPRTRTPVRSRRAAWVSAPRRVLDAMGDPTGCTRCAAAVADALSTAFMVSSLAAIGACCAGHADLEAWIVEEGVTHFPGVPAPHNG